MKVSLMEFFCLSCGKAILIAFITATLRSSTLLLLEYNSHNWTNSSKVSGSERRI